MATMSALHIFGVIVLISINGYFAAVEFSLVAVRQSRIRQLAKEGDPRAKIIENLLGDLGRVISGVQVGITLTSLSLGYLGEVALSRLLDPLVQVIPRPWAALTAHGVALVLAFGLLTVLQVTFGELVPKGLSLARAERVALLVARPFYWFLHTFRWAIDLLDGLADKVLLPLGIDAPASHTLVHSTEELMILLQQAREGGVLPPAQAKFLQNAIELSNVQVREIMVPRPDMHVLPVEAGLDETMRMFATTQRSRLPVYEGTIDHIVGFIHIKDAIWVQLDRTRRIEEGQPAPEFQLKTVLRDVLIVPETKPGNELLLEFRSRRRGIAMVVNEFGSILGLVTMEDILEQMVGEIHDEFDIVERPFPLPDGGVMFDAGLNVRDLRSEYNIALSEDPSFETIGGYVLSHLGFIPRGGESFEQDGYRFTVMEMDKRRISRVKIKPLVPAATQPAEQADEPRSAAAHAGQEPRKR
jgi:magnesium and cobalt exporter, CNNM family